MQLKSWNAAPGMAVCNQHPPAATGHSHPVAELYPPLEWDPCATGSDVQTEFLVPAPKALPVEKSLEEMGKPITSITTSSWEHLQSPVGTLGSSLSRDGFDGIVPVDVDSAASGEQSHDREPWEGSRTCPASPALAGSVFQEINPAGQGRFHPTSAGRDRAGVYQDTDSLSAQDSGSIHAGKRQSPSAEKCDFLAQDGGELGRQSGRAEGLDVTFSQERNPCTEPHSLSSSQQEKSSSGHIQLSKSLEGSDPAEQVDVLQGCGELGEEKESADEPPLVPIAEAEREQVEPSHPSPPEELLSTTSAAPSSPTKKFLSCVHITLSSKVHRLELCRDVNVENGVKLDDKPQVKTQSVPLKAPEGWREAAPELPPAGLVPEGPRSPFPVSSADPSRVFSSGREPERPRVPALGSGGFVPGNIWLPAKPGRRTSEAATQITTEGPGKTTFSAEIHVHSQEEEEAAQKPPELPSVTTSSHIEISPFPRQPAQPLLVPYKPSGSTGMYYVPFLKGGAKMSPVESETNGGSSHSGSNDAPPPPRFVPHLPGLRDENPPGIAALQQKEGCHSKRAKPKLAWAEEQRTPLEDSADHRDHSKPVKPTHSTFKSTRFYLHRPMPTCDSSEFSEDSSGAGIAPPSSGGTWKKPHRHQRVFSAHQRKSGKKEFFPLTAEADESKNEELNVGNEMSGMERRQRRREAEQGAAGNPPLPRSQTTLLEGNVEKPPRQRTHSSGSLDELWVKFLERQRRHQHHDSRSAGELSLVERLDRLARVLQNPVQHTLIPAKAGSNVPERKTEGRERTKTGLGENDTSGSGVEVTATRVGQRAWDNPNLGELREKRGGETTTHHNTEIPGKQHPLESPSDDSWETRLSGEHGTSASEWGTATEPDTTSGRSSSLSTIDTARLLRAFGHRRVRLSPRLSRLYSAISHQKRRSEKWDEGSGEAAGAEYPKVGAERSGKRREIQVWARGKEPLREKNWEGQQHLVVPAAAPDRGAGKGPVLPFVKLTLQEALAVHRPDFISRSGERVKHLKLVMEERRIQRGLQSQREELGNSLGKRKGCRSSTHLLADRGFPVREKRRAIPRSEMVQRSKRIYEQLPEVKKKREEEKRRLEYNSYRLKAQLYKTKITNHVLGKKVPWD
ncbi:Alstrom syndrome protein 1-like [Empidonax traillii]|uniref:Alstrom syndrome protein 1-like n=1 Tax=Empidonax traillii TaxID=164674 RepID=UPI000FFD196A|nr:Alstrom syndrome protein 1-like [Empidonax traillii]